MRIVSFLQNLYLKTTQSASYKRVGKITQLHTHLQTKRKKISHLTILKIQNQIKNIQNSKAPYIGNH